MQLRLSLDCLTYDGIGDFIVNAAEQANGALLYLLGKAAAYVDIASALGRVSILESAELRATICVYAGMHNTKPHK